MSMALWVAIIVAGVSAAGVGVFIAYYYGEGKHKKKPSEPDED